MTGRPTLEWFCTGNRCYHPGDRSPLASLCRVPLPRLTRETWLRYRRPLAHLPPPSPEVSLEPVNAARMEMLRLHPERDQPQIRSAFRFWQAGFGDGYLWLEGNEPLCMIWLVLPHHAAGRAGIGEWAGMYPPLPSRTGIAEGVYAFRRGLRRPGGVATAMATALFHRARQTGLVELRTHIHAANAAAQRWAARAGWEPAGVIQRCSVDLPRLRNHPFYLHFGRASTEPVPVTPAAATQEGAEGKIRSTRDFNATK